jgi:hypothetical protein
VARAIMSNSAALQAQAEEQDDCSLSKLVSGSEFDYDDTNTLKSSIDSIVKHFTGTNAFPEEEYKAAADPSCLMEPALGMERVQLDLMSIMPAKGTQEDWESTDYVKGRAGSTLVGGTRSSNRAAMSTKRGEVSDDQNEQDFLAYIEQVLGPLPMDASTTFAFQ